MLSIRQTSVYTLQKWIVKVQLGVKVDFCVKIASVLVALAEGVGVSISMGAEVNAAFVLVELGEAVLEGEGVGVLRSWIDKP